MAAQRVTTRSRESLAKKARPGSAAATQKGRGGKAARVQSAAKSKGTSNLKARKKSKAVRLAARPGPADGDIMMNAGEILEMRALLWSNVLRETLCALCAESARMEREHGRVRAETDRGGRRDSGRELAPTDRGGAGEDGASGNPEGGQHEPGTVLDGHLALVTSTGERIQVAAIRPAIEFGMAANDQQRRICMAVDATVFHVRTPMGDVFTLPLHEIRSIHGLSESIMRQLHEAAREEREDAPPFGFAAFRGLSTGRSDAQPQHLPVTPIDPGA